VAATTHSKLSTRDSLLETATRLFALSGFEGTSIREITEASGVNTAMVSYHFDGKEGLYMACIEPYGLKKVEAAKRILVPATKPAEFRSRILEFCDAMFNLWLEQPEISQIVARECVFGMPKTEKLFKNTFFKCFEIFAGFFAAGQQAGFVRADLDPSAMSALLFSAMHEVMRVSPLIKKFHGRDLADPEFRNQLVRNWVSATLDGVIHHTRQPK
jgi:AcrR family transcriptional regulator